jgi:hypothetical protein
VFPALDKFCRSRCVKELRIKRSECVSGQEYPKASPKKGIQPKKECPTDCPTCRFGRRIRPLLAEKSTLLGNFQSKKQNLGDEVGEEESGNGLALLQEE